MQDPNADTEWNDALRRHGIIPQKEKEMTEADLVDMIEQTIAEKQQGKSLEDMDLDELDELEDEEDERVLAQYRAKRLQEMKAFQHRARFGDLVQISAHEFVAEVNKAGEGVWVVLHLYKDGVPLSTLLNQHLLRLAKKFPATKFLKIYSTDCIPNYPDANLPTMLIYHNDKIVRQIVGLSTMGGSSTKMEDVEWALAQLGAVETEMEANPRENRRAGDVLTRSIHRKDNEEDE
eukprot:Opistho-2@95037